MVFVYVIVFKTLFCYNLFFVTILALKTLVDACDGILDASICLNNFDSKLVSKSFSIIFVDISEKFPDKKLVSLANLFVLIKFETKFAEVLAVRSLQVECLS